MRAERPARRDASFARSDAMPERLTTLFAVLFAALVATLGGALLGWGVMRFEGGAAALTQAPLRLSLAQESGQPGRGRDGAADEAARRDGRPVRRRAGTQGSNAPEHWNGAAAPRLAIVIDDIGQSLAAPRELLALRVPLTFSILPDLPHSRGAAEVIAQGRREFIVHLPMEPVDYPVHDPGPSPLLFSLDAQQTRRRIEAYLRELPGATGASNHMGSAYTADAARMELVQQILAERHLFFLNSKTSSSPVPAEIAQSGRFAYLERDVFLDNDRDEARIARQVERAIARARRRGQAIAIGHPYPETVQVLRDTLTGPDVEGVRLVSLSDLLAR
jgi:polysaccharide deacetylase 2 family uncharacterized protein YibQ